MFHGRDPGCGGGSGLEGPLRPEVPIIRGRCPAFTSVGMSERILIVEDDPRTRYLIRARLLEWGYQPMPATSLRDARGLLRKEAPDVALVDVGLPDGSGLDLVAEIRRSGLALGLIMITGNVLADNLVAAMRSGVHFMEKPINYRTLKVAVEAALTDSRRRRSRRGRPRYEADAVGLDQVVGNSAVMRAAIEVARDVAASDSSVLLHGETGTGKDLLARAIHHDSKRASRPLVAVSVAEKPRELVASELFGHEQGAFTGACGRRIGLFEQANGGTLFLDEIGELQPDLQVMLLRAVEERSIRRLGGMKDINLDVRIIAATNRDLSAAIAAGAFREDLYYRLAVIEMNLPPLCRRGDDVILLADHFVEISSRRHGKQIRGISLEVAERFRQYHWPGNVRELSNAIERAVVLAKGELITLDLLPDSLRQGRSFAPTSGGQAGTSPSGLSFDDMQLAAVKGVLAQTGGNVSEAARRLAVSRGKLRHLLNRLEQRAK